MKKVSKTPYTLIAFAISVAAVAAPEKPFITKSSGGGFIAPEAQQYEECEVYANRVVITHRYGSGSPTALQLVEERKIVLKGDVLGVIDRAKAEELTETGVPADVPITSIYANPMEGDEPVLLYSSREKREGVFSRKLIDIVNLYCPQTFDYSNKND